MEDKLITVAELPEYIRSANRLLDQASQKGIIDHLAANPRSGDIIRGTGGVRKLRWSCGSRGKSGGVRVIYYYYDDRIPLYLLTVFGKNEQANLSMAERNDLAKLVGILISSVRKGHS